MGGRMPCHTPTLLCVDGFLKGSKPERPVVAQYWVFQLEPEGKEPQLEANLFMEDVGYRNPVILSWKSNPLGWRLQGLLLFKTARQEELIEEPAKCHDTIIMRGALKCGSHGGWVQNAAGSRMLHAELECGVYWEGKRVEGGAESCLLRGNGRKREWAELVS